MTEAPNRSSAGLLLASDRDLELWERELDNFTSNADKNDLIRRWYDRPWPYAQINSLTVYFPDHTPSNPNDQQFHNMRNEFSLWSTATGKDMWGKGKERIIRCEGRVPEISDTDNEESCIKSERGEVALLGLWAKKSGIPIESFEPNHADLAEAIQHDPRYGRHSRTDFFLAVTNRYLRQINRSMPKNTPSPEQYREAEMRRVIERYADALQWPDFEFSLDNWRNLNGNYFPERPLNILDPNFLSSGTVPDLRSEPKNAIQSTAADILRYREDHAVKVFTEDLRDGKHVFATMGKLHKDPFLERLCM